MSNRNLINLIYPPLCLHCNKETLSSKYLLCEFCLSSLERPGPLPIDIFKGFKAISVPFIHFGAAKTVLFEFKERKAAYLAKGIAAFMAIDILKKNFPLPDLIIPIAQTYLTTLFLGINAPLEIAKQLGKVLQVPVVPGLKRRWGFPLQKHLPLEKRRQLNPEIFFTKQLKGVQGKIVLLVDDEIVTGATLRGAALCLKEFFPKAVYGAAFTVQEL